jgi:hypothetical protein
MPETTPSLDFENVAVANLPLSYDCKRAMVAGGWIVLIERGAHVTSTFVADRHHDWTFEARRSRELFASAKQEPV